MNVLELPFESDTEVDPGVSWHKEILSELASQAQIKGAVYNYDFLEDAPRSSENYRYKWSYARTKKSSANLSSSDSNISKDLRNLEELTQQMQFSRSLKSVTIRSDALLHNNCNHP